MKLPRLAPSSSDFPQSGIPAPMPESPSVRQEKPTLPTTGDQFPELGKALAQLFDGTTFGDKTKDLLKQAMIVDGTAIVDLGDLPERLPEASTAAGSAAFFKPVNSIVFSFPNVKAVVYQVHGSPEAFVEWLGTAGEPLTREQWESIEAGR